MKSLLLHRRDRREMERLHLDHYGTQIQIRHRGVERTGIGQGPDRHRIFVGRYEM